MTKQALEHLLDQVYVLQAAIVDVDRDLPNPKTADKDELRRALNWVLVAARPVAETDLL